jgi:dolichol-phosphate mannosyltransferase
MLPFDKTLIIIPTYNEIANVSAMINAVFQLSPELSILIIDDGSPDGTETMVKELQRQYPRLHLISRPGKLGLGTAYIAGFKWALVRDYDYIFEMDCDFSHDPTEIPSFLKAAETADLVIGSRYIGGIRVMNWPMKRLLLSYFASVYIRLVTGIPVMDATGGFKCFRRRTLEIINLDKIFSKGYAFQIELNFKVFSKKLKITEIPITFHERREGISKMNGKIVKEALWGVLKLRLLKMLGKL